MIRALSFVFIAEKISTKKRILLGVVVSIEANIASNSKCGGAVDNVI